MIVRITHKNRNIYYDKVIKATYNYEIKTLLLELKGFFKNKYILFNGINCNDYEIIRR